MNLYVHSVLFLLLVFSKEEAKRFGVKKLLKALIFQKRAHHDKKRDDSIILDQQKAILGKKHVEK